MPKIKIRGSEFFYEEKNPGRKQTILLIHGHPFNHTMWKYQYNALSGFHLVLPDLKGYGKSDYRFDKIYIEEQAMDLAILLDALGVEGVHLIGLSMGAQIALEFSRLFPHRTKSLVFCDSTPAGENEESHKARLSLADRIQHIGMKAYTEQDIHKYLHPETLLQKCETCEHLNEMMVSTHVDGAVASHKGRAERRDGMVFLPLIRFPVLFIVGDRDFFTPPQEMLTNAKRIQGCRFEIIEGAGHMPNMEQPDKFNEIILDFYNGFVPVK